MKSTYFSLGLISFAACASAPSGHHDYTKLPHDTKVAFLAIYPLLTAGQRENALQGGMSAEEIAEAGDMDLSSLILNYRTLTPRTLEIDASDLKPKEADSFTPRAILIYRDGRKVDATHHTRWDIHPKLANVHQGIVETECTHSDVSLTGTFLGELVATHTLKYRKPLARLEVRVASRAEGASSTTDTVELEVIAHCEDGTSSNISCQADWKTASPGRIRRCGVYEPEKNPPQSIDVTVTYGNLTVNRTLKMPRR